MSVSKQVGDLVSWFGGCQVAWFTALGNAGLTFRLLQFHLIFLIYEMGFWLP